MTIGTIVKNIIARILFILIIVIFFIPIVIFTCIPQKWRYSSKIIFMPIHWFYWAILKASLLPITYSGTENIPDVPVIFAANHQSSLDIPLVGVLSKGIPHVWLAKEELMDSIFIRFLVPLISVLVDVTSPKKSMLSLRKILTLVNNHHRNLMIFPEGARYADGVVHDFFGGFVILAKKTGRPVVPVCIVGVNKVYPPDTYWVHWSPITVIVGKPFVYGADDTDELFKDRVHHWFVEQMERYK
jgi:1-acyl-sn-glycerol-3-phosphate acyltransferase